MSLLPSRICRWVARCRRPPKSARHVAHEQGSCYIACAECGWSNDETLILVDRWVLDYPPVPYTPLFEIYLDKYMDPDDRVMECPSCYGDLLHPESVVVNKLRTP